MSSRKVTVIVLLCIVVALAIGGFVRHRQTNEAAPLPSADRPDTKAVARQDSLLATPSEIFKSDRTPITSIPVVQINPEYPRAFKFARQTQYEPGKAADVARRLEALADSGDAHASYLLFRTINRCTEGLKAAQAQIRDAQAQSPDDKIQVDKEAVLANSQAILDDCEGLDPAVVAKQRGWLTLAAQRGDIEAQLAYSRSLEIFFPSSADLIRDAEDVTRYKADALRFVQSAASRGSVDAIDYLSNYYFNGVMTDRNPILALAYIDAYSALDKSNLQDPRRDQLVSSLTPGQLAAAQDLTRRILEACCK